jgi:hypothetical protein
MVGTNELPRINPRATLLSYRQHTGGSQGKLRVSADKIKSIFISTIDIMKNAQVSPGNSTPITHGEKE